ncbi:MAG: PQQ-dependent sugar dehydrogenase [Oceanospirillaceae bacterium]|nr:PQQ-dependent sugar dehydrogenase [Oceanospirillaceae bacterium]
MRLYKVSGLICLLFFAHLIAAKETPFVIRQLAAELPIPWGMTLVTDNQLLITQRSGSIILLNIDTGTKSPISGGPKVLAQGQGGLLDVVSAPEYASNGWLYFTYVKALRSGGATVLARARLSIEHQQLVDWQDLLVTDSATNESRHFGSRIAFDNSGHVFFSVGDRGVRKNAQNTLNHAGAILRLNLDGTVPADNPFIGDEDYLPEIFSYGHRNPQGLAFDEKRQQLWAIEHGPRGGDEINLIVAGKNYGWPITSHGKEYWGPVSVGEGQTKAGIESPKKVYIPSIAPSSLIVYSGTAFKNWQGDLLAGALKLAHINHLQVRSDKIVNEQRYLSDKKQRIRNVITDEQGRLIIATDNGFIYRLSPTP